LHVEVISDFGRLLEFVPEWEAFALSHPDCTPFQLPVWLVTWWKHFGSGTLCVLAFRDSQLISVVPCFLHEWNGARQLTLIGSGISDYLDPLIAMRQQQKVADCLENELSTLAGWDRCDWQDLAFDTPLAAITADRFDLTKHEEVICSQARLPQTFEDFWHQRPRHLRRNVRRYAEKARQLAPLSFHVSTEAELCLIDSLVNLHTVRWRARGESGMIEANHSAAFLQDVAVRLAERNLLRIFSLRYNGRIAAIILAFVFNGSLYGYLTGSDPACKQLSVASILLHDALRYCCGEGMSAWNFCRGDESYKTDWGAEAIRRCRVLLEHKRS
jgi:CelD/BcsL family acetyltransferase involved in cellulose biosynthesis